MKNKETINENRVNASVTTRRIKLRKDDYEHGVDRARKIIDGGKKDKK